MVCDFYYSLLSTAGKAVYEKIYASLLIEKYEIDVDMTKINDNEISTIVSAVFDDHPEISVCEAWSISYTSSHIRFKNQVISWHKRHDECKYLDSFTKMVRQQCITDYEKVKFVHDFIINSVSFDHDEINNKKTVFSNHNSIGALERGISVCEGIARLAQLLLLTCGVYAVYCGGYTKSNDENEKKEDHGHAWVVVRIDGKHYHLDVSHDVCITENKGLKEYCFFCLCHEDITKDHEIEKEEAFKALDCNYRDHDYFNYNGCYFSSLTDFENKLCEALDKAIRKKHKNTYFRLKVSSEFCKKYAISWDKICLGQIYRVFDKYVKTYRNIKISYDENIYCDLEQRVLSVNFTFKY